MSDSRQLILEIVEEGADREQLEEGALKLRKALLEMHVLSTFPQISVPDQAKGAAGIETAGALIVMLSQSPEVLAAIVNGVVGWVGRQTRRSVKLTIEGDSIEVTAISSTEQKRLIELFLRRHE